MKLSALGLVVATAVVWSAPVTIDLSPTKTPSLSVDTADARLGRPLIAAGIGVRSTGRRRPARSVKALSRVLVFAEAKEHRLPGGALGE